MTPGEWADPCRAGAYLDRADSIPHRREGEAVLLDHLPAAVRRVLDLGCGDGRLLALVLAARPGATGVALDASPPMLAAASARFAGRADVEVVDHDMRRPLPDLGRFDAVVSSFAIHHLVHARKRALAREVLAALEPGGVFANLEHVASPTPRMHERFMRAIGLEPADEDPSNRLAPVPLQLRWLRTAGFAEVDCHWKWLELALLVGERPAGPPAPAGPVRAPS
jgi:SAM-dependent methyltransferase